MHGWRTLVAEEQDWQTFLRLAAAEGWRVPASEIRFHRRPDADSAVALRRGEETIGFVTAVPHQRSGWIGNLLIAPHARGRGYGALLFDLARRTLRSRGMTCQWLTASSQGAPLYRRRGFEPCGRVTRWIRTAGGEGARPPAASCALRGFAADRAVWQESRHTLLAHLAGTNPWLASGHGIALLQRETDRQIIGPWIKLPGGSAPLSLLTELVAIAEPGKELVLDLVDNPEVGRELLQMDFVCVGETLLMACGASGDVRLDRLYALASLGSIG